MTGVRNSRSIPCRRPNIAGQSLSRRATQGVEGAPAISAPSVGCQGAVPSDALAEDLTTFQKERAAAHVHSHVFVSMAAHRYVRNEGSSGARDSRLAGANSWVGRDQLQREHFPALARIHAWRSDEIPG